MGERKSRWRTWTWRAALAIALACAAASALVIGIREGLARESLRSWVEEYASAALGAELRIGEIEGRLLPELQLRDVELLTDGRPLARARRARLRVDLDPLLSGGLPRIGEIRVDGLVVSLWRNEGGSWNFQHLAATRPPEDSADTGAQPPEQAPPPSQPLVIERIVLSDSTVEIEDADRRSRTGVEATLTDLRLPFDPAAAEALGGRLRITPEGQPTAEVTVEHGRVRLGSVALEIAGGRVELEAEAGLADWLAPDHDARVRLRAATFDIDPSTIPGLDAPEGSVSGRIAADVQRRNGELGAAFDIALGPGRLDVLELERALVRGRLRGEEWTLEEGLLEAVGVTAVAQGRGEGAAIGQLVLSLEAADLVPLARLLEIPLTGSASVEADLSGELEQLRGTVSITGGAIEVGGIALGSLDLKARVRSPVRFAIDELRIEGDDVVAGLNGPAEIDVSKGPARARAENLVLSIEARDLAPLAALLELPVTVGGSARLDAELTGGATGATGHVRLRADGLVLAGTELGVLELRAEPSSVDRWVVTVFSVRGGEIEASLLTPTGVDLSDGLAITGLDLESSVIGSLRLDGALRDGQLADVVVDAERIDGAGLAGLAGYAADKLGQGSLSLALSGPIERPEGTARLEWREPDLDQVGIDVLAGRVAAEAGRISIELRGLDASSEAPIFALDAQAPWLAEIALDALLEQPGTVVRLTARDETITRITRLMPDPLRSATGLVSLDLRIAGGPEGPRVDGSLELTKGSIRIPLAGQRFEPIEARLRLGGDRIDVERLTAGPPGAQARIHGVIELVDLLPARTRLLGELEHFRFANSSLLRAKANGSLRLEGPIEELLLEGKVALEEVRVTLPEEEDRELREIQVLAASAGDRDASDFVETRRAPGPLARARIDVQLEVPAGSRVRGRGVDLQLAGELGLEKEPLDVARLNGEARTLRGSIEFQRKRFDIRKGIVRFDGGSDPADPVVDIVGVHRVRDVAVILRASGRLSDPPRVELDGEPPMSSDEALAYLVFGRPLDELRDSERGNVQSAAASLAASVALNEFSRLITRTGIIDTIDIEFAEDGSLGALRVGTYIGNDTYVRAGNAFGTENEQEFHVEYRLTPYLSVESQLSTSGDAGGDLILRLDY